MREIKLTQGMTTLVDDEDFESLSKFKWCAANITGNYYSIRRYRGTDGKQYGRFMHREILNCSPAEKTDHKDGNGLNNQKDNIRICSQQQNTFNKRISRNNKSGFKGVSWLKNTKKWYASIKINRKTRNLGYFKTREEAAKAYDRAAINFFGDFAKLNFSDKGGSVCLRT